MSNLGQFGNKNAPWARANTSPNLVNQNNSLQPQIMNQGGLGALGNQGLVQFQQHQQVFQNAIGLQQQNLGLGLQQMANNAMGTASLGSQLASNSIFQQVGAVTYPNSRGLNPTAFQQQNMGNMSSGQGNPNSGIKQRVFTGTVTTVHDNFGFIDDEVFFPRNVCVKGSNPMVGDRVLVEASFNSTTPFKWNASRIQVIPANNQNQSMHQVNSKAFSHSNNYSAVPPPSENNNNNNNNHFGRNRPKASAGGRGRERSRERDRDEDEVERKRRREERMREREKEDKKSPVRRRSRSPKSRRRSRIVPRYMVQIPKIALNLPEGDVLELRRRYTNLYIPSDFFFTQFRWVDAFPPHKPCMLNKPCSFHIINKELDPVVENTAVLEPPDTDYSFSAKVMLMCIPGLEELYQKCCSMAEDKDSDEKDFVHPTRLINFLVGLRGKNETMAIGGPWSPSLDGENPDKDPAVLIRTAIRTCKALTGIDLSHCTQWYRFLELYYRRSDTTHKGKPVPARVETVVLFLPDIWSCLPTRLEWEGLHQIYRKHLEALLKSNADKEADEASATDEKEEEVQTDKVEPTHYSQLDPKTMAVGALRTELKARNVNSKGLKSQLVARLTKALKAEAEKDEEKETEVGEEKSCDSEPAAADVVLEEKKTEVEDKVLGEKEKALLEKRFKLPEQPHIIVHPSKTAKSGKFDCTTMSLSLLLDYRPEDTKEHSFEVSLFAELFNEMLMRDFGFNIFKVLYKMPEKPKEKDEKKKKDDDKKKDKKEDENGKKSEDRKDDKKSEDDSKKDRNDDKKSDKKSDESNDEDDTEEGGSEKKGKKDKEKRKKDRVKMYTKDRHLLLSFVYFDQSHCGYIFDRDIEELIFTLGLDLSRAQVRKLVAKVVVRDSLHYRKLTDKPKDEEIPMEMEEDKTDSGEELALLNKKLLPVFHEVGRPGRRLEGSSTEGVAAVSSDEGLVTFRGGVVDIGKLLSQLERSEKTRLETESRLVEIKSENNKLLEKYNKSHSTIKHLNSEVKEYKDKLRVSDDSLTRITNQSKTFQTLLSDIQSQIEPVLQKASQKEDKDKKHEEKAKEEKSKDDKKYDEKKHEDKKHEQENKSRWEKDGKKSLNDEVKSELKLEINSSEQIVVKKEIDNIT